MKKLEVGDAAHLTRVVDETAVNLFAQATGDRNSIHLDDSAARAAGFDGRIAHGMFSASLVSQVLGMQLPGPGTIYLGQQIRFGVPVRIGDTLAVSVTVKSIRPDKPIVTLETGCKNQKGEDVLTGEAVVKVSRDRC
jgi:3-hydroxybutyryl-CoA dehydratase